MTPELVQQLFGDALFLIILIVGVLVVPSLVVGLIISVFQAATQINEQTLSFLPRLFVTLAMLGWAGPWLLTMLMEHFSFLFHNIPIMIGQ